jgi:hypothetical protein
MGAPKTATNPSCETTVSVPSYRRIADVACSIRRFISESTISAATGSATDGATAS